MIVYKRKKELFLTDVSDSNIEDIIRENVATNLNRNVGNNEFQSWRNSLNFMYHVLNSDKIPKDCIIAIEYNIPRTSSRIDIIITGQNELQKDFLIIIELKQWTEIRSTSKDAIVITRFSHGLVERPHPSYQAWSYSALLQGFNVTVYKEDISLKPCAYLHNYTDDGVLKNEFYSEYLKKAPVFCKGEKNDLQEFISNFIKYGDKTDIIERIENGKISPSKSLADSLSSMLRGNEEFIMIDSQKIVYENAKALAKKSNDKNKNVLIVRGGPGTGKSVIAINLLVNLTKMQIFSQYVTKNAAPRTVYEAKLTDSFKKSEISNFFTGSGSFINTKSNTFGALIVDEAHRLNEKSGMFKNKGENQIKEIINASKFSVFFLDEDQKVTLHDIGEEDEIKKWAVHYNANVSALELSSQFRCNGSEGYLAWLDDVLQIRKTANNKLSKKEFDFRIFDDPNELRDKIFHLNKANNKARLVAGYCWPWASKKKPNAFDIVIPEFDFKMQWNLGSDGNLWIINPDSVKEIGCIHTCQGLELEYVGVIVGSDLIVKFGEVLVDPSKRAPEDSSVRGWKTRMKDNPAKTRAILKSIIKNTYRTLMTRGMKGCYVYFVDKETDEYFRSRLA